MKTTLYTNIILTIIALLIASLVLQNTGIMPMPRRDVQIVSIARPNDTSIYIRNDAKWDYLPLDKVEIDGPVEVENTSPLSVEIERDY